MLLEISLAIKLFVSIASTKAESWNMQKTIFHVKLKTSLG